MKICFKCGDEKELNEFNKDKTTKSGYNAKCKSCCKKYLDDNKIKVSKQHQDHYLKNKDKIKILHQKYKSKPEIKLYYKNYGKEYNKEYYNIPEVKERQKNYMKAYNLNDEVVKRRNEKFREKWKTDPLFKLIKLTRTRLYQILGSKRSKKSIKVLGCTLEELKLHIEKQWGDWMNWNNWGFGDGKWVIDHIIPLSSAETEDDVYKLFHYSNLRPLEWKENLLKSDNIYN